MERYDFFKGERVAADLHLPIPERGETHYKSTLQWIPIEHETVPCNSELSWTLKRTIGMEQRHHEELEALMKASVGLNFLTSLDLQLKGKVSEETVFSNVVTQEKTFKVTGRECYDLDVTIYQLRNTIELSCEWKPRVGRKKYFEHTLHIWLAQFHRALDATARHESCGCSPNSGEIVGQLSITTPSYTMTEPYLVHNRLLVSFTTGLSVDAGDVVTRRGQGGDNRWPPGDKAPRDWSIDLDDSEERLVTPLSDQAFEMPASIFPEYMNYLSGLTDDATIEVFFKVLSKAHPPQQLLTTNG